MNQVKKVNLRKNKKNKIGISVLIIIILLIIILGNLAVKTLIKPQENLDDIKGFEYFNGSSSFSIELKGNKQREQINVDFEKFRGANKDTGKLTIKFNDFKELLINAKIDDCKKHTYSYQCGDLDGCSYSTFFVYFQNNVKVCYEVTSSISDFFNNLIK